MGNIPQTGVEPLAEAVNLHVGDVQAWCPFTPRLLYGAQNLPICLYSSQLPSCSEVRIAPRNDGVCSQRVPAL